MGTRMWVLRIKKLLQQHQLQSNHSLNHQTFQEHQQEIDNNQIHLQILFPQCCFKKEGGCDGFIRKSGNIEININTVSKNKRRTYLTTLLLSGRVTTTKLNFIPIL